MATTAALVCRREACAQPLTRCPGKHRTGSCWYFACKGYVHQATGAHSCADYSGDAEPQQDTGKATA